MFFRLFDTRLPSFAFWAKNGIFITHDGKSNEALTFSAETQILPGLEVILILLDICAGFLSVCHSICQPVGFGASFLFWTDDQTEKKKTFLALGSKVTLQHRPECVKYI